MLPEIVNLNFDHMLELLKGLGDDFAGHARALKDFTLPLGNGMKFHVYTDEDSRVIPGLYRTIIKSPKTIIRPTYGHDSVCSVCSNYVMDSCVIFPLEKLLFGDHRTHADFFPMFSRDRPTPVSELIRTGIDYYTCRTCQPSSF